MKCKKCNSENSDNALFCRVCGEKIGNSNKGLLYGIWNTLFWIGLVISLYCFISVVFPIESYRDLFGSSHLYCSDPFGINRDGKSYYMQEWMSALIVATLVTALLFVLRKKSLKQ